MVHLPGSPELIRIVERVRRIFDLGADPRQIGDHLRRDPALAPLIAARPGLRVPGAWDGFELGVRAILGQQVSVRGATTLAGRLVRRCGEPLRGEMPEGLTHLFPRPERLARADLSSIGMPGARVEAVRTLARAVARGDLRLDGALELEETLARMRALPGLGPWTAGYVAMRGLCEPDGFPYGDLGLRRAVSTNGRPVSSASLDRMADAWRPWRAYAAMHLWSAETASPPKEAPHAALDR